MNAERYEQLYQEMNPGSRPATEQSKHTPLYHHKTDGGAEYLTDKFILCPNGDKEGVFEGATIIIRIDGDITKDAEIIRNQHAALLAENARLRAALEGMLAVHASYSDLSAPSLSLHERAMLNAQARAALAKG